MQASSDMTASSAMAHASATSSSPRLLSPMGSRVVLSGRGVDAFKRESHVKTTDDVLERLNAFTPQAPASAVSQASASSASLQLSAAAPIEQSAGERSAKAADAHGPLSPDKLRPPQRAADERGSSPPSEALSDAQYTTPPRDTSLGVNMSTLSIDTAFMPPLEARPWSSNYQQVLTRQRNVAGLHGDPKAPKLSPELIAARDFRLQLNWERNQEMRVEKSFHEQSIQETSEWTRQRGRHLQVEAFDQKKDMAASVESHRQRNLEGGLKEKRDQKERMHRTSVRQAKAIAQLRADKVQSRTGRTEKALAAELFARESILHQRARRAAARSVSPPRLSVEESRSPSPPSSPFAFPDAAAPRTDPFSPSLVDAALGVVPPPSPPPQASSVQPPPRAVVALRMGVNDDLPWAEAAARACVVKIRLVPTDPTEVLDTVTARLTELRRERQQRTDKQRQTAKTAAKLRAAEMAKALAVQAPAMVINLADSHAHTRSAAAVKLAKLRPVELLPHIDALVRALDDLRGDVRTAVAAAVRKASRADDSAWLAKLDTHADALLRAASTDKESGVRVAVTFALCATPKTVLFLSKSSDRLRMLVRKLDDTDGTVRATVASALQHLEPTALAMHIPELIRRFESSGDKVVRRGALAALETLPVDDIGPLTALALRRRQVDVDDDVAAAASRIVRKLPRRAVSARRHRSPAAIARRPVVSPGWPGLVGG